MLSKIQWGLLEVQIVSYILSKNIEDEVKMTFSFSLCTTSLWVALSYIFQMEYSEHDKWLSLLEDVRYIIVYTES